MGRMLWLTLSAAYVLLAASIDNPLVDDEAVCESCKAMVYEAEVTIGSRERTDAVIAEALDNICSEEHMKSFEANLPAILMLGCQKVLQEYNAEEEVLEALVRDNPPPKGYKKICKKACRGKKTKKLLKEPAQKMDPESMREKRREKERKKLEDYKKTKKLNEALGNIQFGDHQLNEEEKNSESIPDRPELRCDACSIVTQYMAGNLLHAEAFRKRPLSEMQRDAVYEWIGKKKGAYDGMGVYTNVPGPNGDQVRFQVPGQFPPSAEFPVRMEAKSDSWAGKLRAVTKGMLEKIGDQEFYELFMKHVPAPEKLSRTVSAEAHFEGVEKFMREICVAPEEQEEQAGGKKKRKKGKSSQDATGSCSSEDLFFNMKGWMEVLPKAHGDVSMGHVEL